MRIRRLLILLLLGFILGFAIWQIDRHGYFAKWENLPIPPSKPNRLIISREFDLYVEANKNVVFLWDGREWSEGTVPDDINNGWQISVPCKHTWPEFSPFSKPPKSVISCVQDEGIYAEFFNKHVYALDGHYQIWQWELLRHGFSDLLNLMKYLLLGGVLGFVGFFVLERRNTKEQVHK